MSDHNKKIIDEFASVLRRLSKAKTKKQRAAILLHADDMAKYGTHENPCTNLYDRSPSSDK